MHNSSSTNRSRLRQHLWVLLGLTILALAYFAMVDRGNSFGGDDWVNIVSVVDRAVLSGLTNRPLNRLAQNIMFNVFDVHPFGIYAAFLTLRITTGFLIYLIVRRFSEDDPIFAAAVAGIYLTFLVPDYGLLLFVVRTNKAGALVFALLALYLHLRAMDSFRRIDTASKALRSTFLIPYGLSFVFAWIATSAFEGTIPLLAVLPLIAFWVRRDFARGRLIALALWLGFISLGTIRYVLPVLGLVPTTYASNSVESNLSLGGMITDSLNQYWMVFGRMLLTEPARLAPYRLPMLITVGVLLLALAIWRRKLPIPVHLSTREGLRRYGMWLMVGIVATWLGFAAYLPSLYIKRIQRIHVNALMGEALAMVAAVWLITALLRSTKAQRWARALGLTLIAAYGTATVGTLQDDLEALGATWNTEAYYVRSLTHLVPAVEPNTLFVLMEEPGQPEVPFITGWAFDYAMRYFYEGQASGMIASDRLYFHVKIITDEGIGVEPESYIAADHPLAEHRFYGWDEVIFVNKDEQGRAVILEAVPERFYAPVRAAQYHPYERIRDGFIPNRVREMMPPIQKVDP